MRTWQGRRAGGQDGGLCGAERRKFRGNGPRKGKRQPYAVFPLWGRASRVRDGRGDDTCSSPPYRWTIPGTGKGGT